MRGTFCKILIGGRLGDDPELKYRPDGTAVVTAYVAVNTWIGPSKDEGGYERTDWHKLTIWGRRAERFAEYARKGHLVYIEGRLEYYVYSPKVGPTQLKPQVVVQDWQIMQWDEHPPEGVNPYKQRRRADGESGDGDVDSTDTTDNQEQTIDPGEIDDDIPF